MLNIENFKQACIEVLAGMRQGIVERVKNSGAAGNLAAFKTKAERAAAVCIHFIETGKLPADTITAFRTGVYADTDKNITKHKWTRGDIANIATAYDASYFAATLTIDHMASGPQLGRVGDVVAIGDWLVAWFDSVTPVFRKMWRDGYVSNFSAGLVPDLNGRGQYLEEISVLGAKRPRVLDLLRSEFGVDAVPGDGGGADLPVVHTPQRQHFAINDALVNIGADGDNQASRKEDRQLDKKQKFLDALTAKGMTAEEAEEQWNLAQPDADADAGATPPAAATPASAKVVTGRINTDAPPAAPAAPDAAPTPAAPDASSTFSAPEIMAKYIEQGKRIEALEADRRASTFSAIGERLVSAGKLGPALLDKFKALCEQASGMRAQVSQFAAPGAAAPADLVEQFVALIEGNTPVPFTGLPQAPGAGSAFAAPGASQFAAQQAAKGAYFDANTDYFAGMKVSRDDYIKYGPDVT